jgi:DinB superfamily
MQMPSSVSTRLHYQHKVLMDIIDGFGDDEIRKSVIAGKWSIFENIVHLQTYQHVFNGRVKQILSENNPSFPRYSAEADPIFLECCGKSTREVMQDLITTRKEMAAALPALPGTDLVKTGTHPHFGKMNLLKWMNFFLLHEAHHLFTIFKLGAELNRK